MSVKRTGQMSFVEALMPAGVGRNERLDRLAGLARTMGFAKVVAGPFVRSSYHADEMVS